MRKKRNGGVLILLKKHLLYTDINIIYCEYYSHSLKGLFLNTVCSDAPSTCLAMTKYRKDLSAILLLFKDYYTIIYCI